MSRDVAELNVRCFDSVSKSTEFVAGEIQRVPEGQTVAVIGRKRAQIIPYQIILASMGVRFCAAEDLQIFLSDTFARLIGLIEARAGFAGRKRPAQAVEAFLELCDQVKRYPIKKTERQAISAYLVERRAADAGALPGGLLLLHRPAQGRQRRGRDEPPFPRGAR